MVFCPVAQSVAQKNLIGHCLYLQAIQGFRVCLVVLGCHLAQDHLDVHQRRGYRVGQQVRENLGHLSDLLIRRCLRRLFVR